MMDEKDELIHHDYDEVFIRLEEKENDNNPLLINSEGIEYYLDNDNTFKTISENDKSDDESQMKCQQTLFNYSKVDLNSNYLHNVSDLHSSNSLCVNKNNLNNKLCLNNDDYTNSAMCRPVVENMELNKIVKRITEKYTILDRLRRNGIEEEVNNTFNDKRCVKEKVLEKFHQVYFQVDKEIVECEVAYCHLCNKAFSSQKSVDRHITLSCPILKQPFQCKCKRRFSDLANLKKHIKKFKIKSHFHDIHLV